MQLLAHTDLKHEGKACYITVNISICPLSHPLPPPRPPMRYTRGSMSTFFSQSKLLFYYHVAEAKYCIFAYQAYKKETKKHAQCCSPSLWANHTGEGSRPASSQHSVNNLVVAVVYFAVCCIYSNKVIRCSWKSVNIFHVFSARLMQKSASSLACHELSMKTLMS